MRIFIEGPAWSGMWTEIAADALQRLGHETAIHYHNRRPPMQRLARRVRRLLGDREDADLARRSNQALAGRMADGAWEVLLSIQGKIDPDTVAALRSRHRGIRIIYWWGDIMTPNGAARIERLRRYVDVLLVSYHGEYERLAASADDGGARVFFFPWGISERFHRTVDLRPQDTRPFACDVAMVGTGYPERCELVRRLNECLREPVRTWGRSWYRCTRTRSGGALDLPNAIRAYGAARIALNPHHPDTNDGVNMKYYEIPAAGGFQLTNAQAWLKRAENDRGVVLYEDFDDLVEKIRYYLDHDEERTRRARDTLALMLEHDRYEQRFAALFDFLATGRRAAEDNYHLAGTAET